MRLDCSKTKLQKIGHKIHVGDDLNPAEEVCFADFRRGHGEILKNFRDRLNKSIKKNVILAGRLKKRETIINKLKDRYSEMDLVRMHDIAGVRLIFENISALNKFRERFTSGDRSKKYIRINNPDKYDYIKSPNLHTGYRGIHDIYEEKTDDSIKMHLELQSRTSVQHAWATTLEIWDSSFGRMAKFGKEKDKNITLLFKYISELFARKLENRSFLKDLSDAVLFAEIIKLDRKTKLLKKLHTIERINYDKPINKASEYVILQKVLDSSVYNNASLKINLNTSQDLDRSFELYKKLEDMHNKLNDIVMVSVKNPDKFLKKAYNNYYNDLSSFFKNYEKCIGMLKHSLGNKWKCIALVNNFTYFIKYPSL